MSRLVIALFLLVIVSLRAAAADWPMWRYDVARTAESPQEVPEDLDLLWRRDLPEPRPAFHDVRLQFDGGYEPVVMGQRLFLASNVEDKVMAFDTGSGVQLWEHFTNGPVRHAPVAWRDRVLFGSDDGCFYCVAATTGELKWKFRAVPSERRLLGNKRLISVWPVRGGPVVLDGRVYFAAGVWPFEGVFIFCFDAATGGRIWVNDSTGHLYGQQPHNAVAIGGIAPQGYLLIDGGDLVVPSSNAYPGRFDIKTGALKDFKLPIGGRVPGGWYASLPGKAAQQNTKRKSLLADIGINVMRHEGGLRTEGKPEVRTTIRAGKRELRFAKGFPSVPGKVHSMIAADDKLFVTTVAGGLYAFGKPDGRTPRHHALDRTTHAKTSPLSTKLLALDYVPQHGYGVLLGAPDAATLAHLAERTELHLIVVEADAGRVATLRQTLVRSGLYGTRIVVTQADPATFQMPPYFASFIVVRNGVTPDSRDRVFESVRPYGGTLIAGSADDLEVTSRDGALPGSTNYHGDFKTSPDELVTAPFGVLWFDDTLGHFKRAPQPKFIDGVMVSTDKTWLDMSTHRETIDFRLLPPVFSDVYTGRILSEKESAHLKDQPFAKVDLQTVQQKQYRPPTQKDPWTPDPPKAGSRRNPLTGETEPRTFPKSYGCDGGFDYGHLYTLRSGTASFYDKRIESGTVNISGPRSGCTNSIIPANGLLNLPYFYKGCTCSYPLPTGLALFSLPETHEQWMTWGAIDRKRLAGKIRRLGINFGAPADRMTKSGTLWLDYPSAGGPSPDVEIVTVPAKPRTYYHHSVWMKGGDALPWVAASGIEGVESVTVKGLKSGTYHVHLTFANPTEDPRRFDIRLQGQTVAENFGPQGKLVGTMKSFADIASDGSIKLELAARTGRTQLSGIEIVPTAQDEVDGTSP